MNVTFYYQLINFDIIYIDEDDKILVDRIGKVHHFQRDRHPKFEYLPVGNLKKGYLTSVALCE